MSSFLKVPYMVIEIVAFIAVAQWLGWGWAFVALLGLFIVGTAISAFEMKRVTERALTQQMHEGQAIIEGRAEADPERAISRAGTVMADSAMLIVGSVLMAIPGFVTSILGLFLILPPTRWVLRKVGSMAMLKWFTKIGNESLFKVQQYGVRYPEGFNNGSPQDGSGAPGTSRPADVIDEMSDEEFFKNFVVPDDARELTDPTPDSDDDSDESGSYDPSDKPKD